MELSEAKEEIARKEAELLLAQDQTKDLKEMQDLLEGWDTGSGKAEKEFLTPGQTNFSLQRISSLFHRKD